MRKQSGSIGVIFLISLVVLGLVAFIVFSAYPEHLKRTRDDQRVKDLTTLQTLILEYKQKNGSFPETAAMVDMLASQSNTYQRIRDPREWTQACIASIAMMPPVECTYVYRRCDAWNGFVIGTRFESASRHPQYLSDPVTASGSSAFTDGSMFEVGTCTVYDGDIVTRINSRELDPLPL